MWLISHQQYDKKISTATTNFITIPYKLMSQFLKYKTQQKIVIKKFIYYVINVALVTFINTFNKVSYC